MKEGIATELVDRYLHEVGEYLPSRLRADVEAEPPVPRGTRLRFHP